MPSSSLVPPFPQLLSTPLTEILNLPCHFFFWNHSSFFFTAFTRPKILASHPVDVSDVFFSILKPCFSLLESMILNEPRPLTVKCINSQECPWRLSQVCSFGLDEHEHHPWELASDLYLRLKLFETKWTSRWMLSKRIKQSLRVPLLKTVDLRIFHLLYLDSCFWVRVGHPMASFQGLMSVYCLYSLIISDVGPFDARDKTVPWTLKDAQFDAWKMHRDDLHAILLQPRCSWGWNSTVLFVIITSYSCPFMKVFRFEVFWHANCVWGMVGQLTLLAAFVLKSGMMLGLQFWSDLVPVRSCEFFQLFL